MQDDRRSYTFAYYCSGHGYGHATRVVALTHELLLRSHNIHLCTNAPSHIFSTAIGSGASYRHAEIDAGIVQPKAYDVARRETVEGLRRFLGERDDKLQKEVEWLKSINADAVLVDAPFLPCAAAAIAGIPSIIISNFTFDSCYSYLSVSTEAEHAVIPTSNLSPIRISSGRISPSLSLHESNGSYSIPSPSASEDEPEAPIPAEVLEPLVNQAVQDYSNASLLLRLPGCIPLPSFDMDVPLPASRWTDLSKHSFKQEIMNLLGRDPASIPCNSTFSFPSSKASENGKRTRRKRRVVDVPLIARPLAKDIYTQQARTRVLSSIDIPEHLHDPDQTKILVVSFGGQSIPRPVSRPPSPSKSYSASPTSMSRSESNEGYVNISRRDSLDVKLSNFSISPPPRFAKAYQQNGSLSVSPLANGLVVPADEDEDEPEPRPRTRRLMTEHHLYLPGAPPALHQSLPPSPLTASTSGTTRADNRLSLEIPEVQELEIPYNLNGNEEDDGDEEGLLPEGWIAIVCGLSGKEKDDDLPLGFYAAPRDVYMPDLTATCDVLLGKLGYGTCSETVSTQTPFVYVPRPLFVEEFGLKRLMEISGTALPMSRTDFEAGRWSSLIAEAHELGKAKKASHRKQFSLKREGEDSVASTVIAMEVEKFMREE